MDLKEAIFFWLAIALYLVSSLLMISGFAFRKTGFQRAAGFFLHGGFACHFCALLFRWIATGHPPVMRHYENALAGAWVVVLFLLFIRRAVRAAEPLSLILTPFAVLMMGYGVMNVPVIEPYTAVFRTPWLAVHIVFAWLAYGSFVAAFGAGIAYLVRERRVRKFGMDGGEEKSLESLDELECRLIVFGFISSTIMILAGSIWASRLWGSYWGWDPIETWSLISWVLYGIYLHLRYVFRWKGRIMALIAVLALITTLISFWGVNYVMSSIHNFRTM